MYYFGCISYQNKLNFERKSRKVKKIENPKKHFLILGLYEEAIHIFDKETERSIRK